ncbi:hypothetical protein REJC140_00099 [Pseudorhizobium endolithicum]|uniref:Uncharacterized protein n=1 Tax=Pseudorhizobium endolithicum TaxID=1191678 RepID=A0ABM8PCH3_9HYPH|nr:hypothetical protein [Pseudorhizobium endolithicum]CAD7023118.1 hypothetical protein REJC140_00099 [Pseudorhizobium endolithicum]
MKRTVIGSHFGQTGVYISQPGDDLDNPQKSLLLDSRFSETLNVHFTERVRLNSSDNFNNTWRYWIIRSYPSIGFNPQYYLALVLWASNTVRYPSGISSAHGRPVENLQVSVGPSSISVDMNIGGDEMDLDLFYVVYRNPL